MKLGIVLAILGIAIVTFGGEFGQKAPRSALAAEPPPCIDTFDGLVSWWPGDGNADDIQGSNSGTLENGAKLTVARVGDGFEFDGEDAYVSVPDSESLDVAPGLTVNAWIYWEGFGDDYESIVVAREGAFELGIRSFGGAQVYASIQQVGSGTAFITSGANFLPQERWVYLSLVFDPTQGEVIIYVDGSVYAREPLANQSSVLASEGGLSIGGKVDGSGFLGRIDEVELYGRPLTQPEIESLITAAESGKCSGSIEVVLEVVPSWNETVIDLIVNGEVKANDLVGSGTTGKVRVPPGDQTVGRLDGEGYYLQGFVTAYECRDADSHVIRWSNAHTLAELPVNNGQFVTCTMTLYESGCDGAAYENVIIGDDDNNVLTGTEGRDVILGLRGDDIIDGLGGDDCLVGGPGADDVTGGSGDDIINNQIGTPPPPPPPPPVIEPPVVDPVLVGEEPTADPAE